MEDMKPGQVIAPQSSPAPDPPTDSAPPTERPAETVPVAAVPPPSPEPAIPAPTPEPTNPVPVEVQSAPQPAPDPTPKNSSDGWQFRQEQPAADMAPQTPLPEAISWTTSEFTARDKHAGWYGLVVLAGVACAVLGYFVTKDVVTVVCIVVATLLLAVAGARKPRSLQYSLNHQGVQVGQRFYGFHDFKTFSVAEESGSASVVFMPLRRFMPVLTVPLDAGVEDQAVDFLSAILPFEPHKADAVDGLLRRIRF